MARNIFDFATKELAQDAFLRWLFASYEDPDLEEVVYHLLKEFCDLKDDERITSITTKAQWKKIDITTKIKTNKRDISLFIEDKTFSSVSNQLSTYDTVIKEVKGREIYKVFYKTHFVEYTELQKIEEVNVANRQNQQKEWEIFDIDKIYELFTKFEKTTQLLLSQYIEHVNQIHEALHNTVKPINNDNYLKWEGYFRNTIIPQLEGNHQEYECVASKTSRFPYVALWVTKGKGVYNDIPYLEIRSRDCLKDNFISWVLYGKKIRKANDKNHQILNKTSVITDEQFIDLVKMSIDKYLEEMKYRQ